MLIEQTLEKMNAMKLSGMAEALRQQGGSAMGYGTDDFEVEPSSCNPGPPNHQRIPPIFAPLSLSHFSLLPSPFSFSFSPLSSERTY